MTAPRAMHASVFPARAICQFLRVRRPTLVIPTTMIFCSCHPQLGLKPLLFFHIRFFTMRVVCSTRIQIKAAPTVNRCFSVAPSHASFGPYVTASQAI